jgi:hypothetical protein
MFELHITPNPDFLEDFIDIAQRLKLKLISHWNLDINGNIIYLETMIAEKCKDLNELNSKIELMIRTAKQHNLLRIKVESMIKEDFSCKIPYKMGSQYYEVHIDILTKEITEDISWICENFKCAISKNPDKETFMLTHRCSNKDEYKNNISSIIKELTNYNISYKRVLKEYCFLDDNIEVDDRWLKAYNF